MSDFFDDFFDDGFGWEELAALGALAEELSEDEKERLQLEREMEKEMNESCCSKDDEFDTSGEEFIP